MCERWRENFCAFYEDMGASPPGHTLERLNVNEGYSKDNCTWVPKAVQARNRRDTVWVDVDGSRVCLAVAARALGIPAQTLYSRVKRGLTGIQLLAPPQKRAL